MSGQASELSPGMVLGPADGVAYVPIGNEVVLYRAAGAASLVLNAAAGLLWQCLDRSSPLGDILDDLAHAFGADRKTVEDDCLPVLRAWLAEGLVEEVAGG